MKSIQSVEEFRTLSRSGKPFCAVFSADWCPDCQVIKAALQEIESDYGDKFHFAVVDRDRFMELGEEFDVLGIPSFLVFSDDSLVDTFVSGRRKTRREIVQFLDGAYSKSSRRRAAMSGSQ